MPATTVSFSRAEVLPVLKVAAKYSKPLIFARDHGAYLMVDIIGEEGHDKNIVLYVRGCDPDKGDVWQTVRDRFGRDAFGIEVMDAEDVKMSLQLLTVAKSGKLQIDFTERYVTAKTFHNKLA